MRYSDFEQHKLDEDFDYAEELRQTRLARAKARREQMTDPDAMAKRIAEWFGFEWDSLRDGRISERGFKVWGFTGIGHRTFQGGKEDLRDLATEIIAISLGQTII